MTTIWILSVTSWGRSANINPMATMLDRVRCSWHWGVLAGAVGCAVAGGDESGSSASSTAGDGSTTVGATAVGSTEGVDETSDGSDPADPGMICERLIECAGQAGLLVTPLIELYGPDGTCWENFDPAACVLDCEATAAPLELSCGPLAPACCPAPVVDLSTTENGCVDLATMTVADVLLDQDGPAPSCMAIDEPRAGSTPAGVSIAADCSLAGMPTTEFLGYYIWLIEVEQAGRSQAVPVCIAVGEPATVFLDDGTGLQSATQPLAGSFGDGPVSFVGPDIVALTDLCAGGGCESFFHRFIFFATNSLFDLPVLEDMLLDGFAGVRHTLELEGPGPGPDISRGDPWVYDLDIAWCFGEDPDCDPETDAEAFVHLSILMNPG